MKTRNRILLVGLLVLALGTFAWLTPRQSQPITVTGSLPAKDLAYIESAVHHEIWRGAFPDSSMKTFKQLPANVNLRLSMHIAKVAVWNEDTVTVIVLSSKRPLNEWFYNLKRTQSSWAVLNSHWVEGIGYTFKTNAFRSIKPSSATDAGLK